MKPPLVCVLCCIFLPCTAVEASSPALQWGGQARLQATLSHYDENDVVARAGDQERFLDGGGDIRLNSTLFFNDAFSFDLAYESVMTGGETRQAVSNLAVAESGTTLLSTAPPSDASQLFSLTGTISETEEYLWYHRIDRLALTWDTDFGIFKLGRQALTWGNGLVFNPADLINPFAPADIIRDYKIGSDMVLYQGSGAVLADLQCVLVPHRDPADGKVDGSLTTYGAKAKISRDSLDIDVLAVSNYGDPVIGAGLTGYLGQAAVRSDLTMTMPADAADTDSYLSAVVNIDYSWTWSEKNWYGLAEVYYNGLGRATPQEALADPFYRQKLQRGELFVTGKWYLAGLLQYEAHPLVNLFASVIVNLKDGSLLLQPRLNWDVAESIQLLTGFNLPAGGTGSEFGGIETTQPGVTFGRPVQAYLLVTWYF